MSVGQSVIIAHRYPLDRMALRQTLVMQHPCQQITEVISWPELLWSLGRRGKVGMLLLDLSLLDQYSLDHLHDLYKRHRSLKVIVIAHRHHRVNSYRLREVGVQASVSTRDTQMTVLRVLDRVNRGLHWFSENSSEEATAPPAHLRKLSAQELRVLQKIDEGLMNKQIASELEIALSTTKVHVCSILRKLGVRNRTQALMAYREQVRADKSLVVT